ncbi:hypothetical protein [Agromyces sp. Soil535]|uniref:hypothetical protein n=1 Tax=Agromyces sp. Soil535 TaxID=1736390 RepID=UPI0006F7AD60|nr:hypothetical protein [Agromyces sp. Soil535]KRE20948.1 hypothetical protein ASG80_14835 [Agromyces sp. Soil535]
MALAVLAAELALATPRRGIRWWALYAASVVAAGLMHLFALLAVLPVAILCGVRGRRALGAFAAATTVAGVALLPFALLAMTQRAQVGWITAPDASTAARILTNVVAYRSAGAADPAALAAYALTGGLAALAAIMTWRAATRHRDRTEVARLGTALGMAIAPWAVLLVITLTAVPVLRTAYIAPSVLGVALVVAGSVHTVVAAPRDASVVAAGVAEATRSRRALLAPVVIGAQVLLIGTGTVADARTTWWQDDFRGLAEAVEERARPGDLVVVVQRHHETGLAAGLARYAGDAAYSRELLDRLPGGAQPLVDARRVIDTRPLRTHAAGPASVLDDRVWLVTTRSPLTRSEVDALEEAGFACVADASAESSSQFGGLRMLGSSCEPSVSRHPLATAARR